MRIRQGEQRLIESSNVLLFRSPAYSFFLDSSWPSWYITCMEKDHQINHRKKITTRTGGHEYFGNVKLKSNCPVKIGDIVFWNDYDFADKQIRISGFIFEDKTLLNFYSAKSFQDGMIIPLYTSTYNLYWWKEKEQ